MKRRLCKCGCGQLPTGEYAFVWGHKKIWEENWKEICACGCGQITEPGKKYVHNHHMRGKRRSKSFRENLRIAASNRSDEYLEKQRISQRVSWEDPTIRNKRMRGIRLSITPKRLHNQRVAQRKYEARVQKDPELKRLRSIRRSEINLKFFASLSDREMQEFIAARPRFGRSSFGRGGRPTGLEKVVRVAARGTYIRYTGDNRKCIAHYFPDFLHIGKRKIIEVDSDYFHKKPNAIKRDQEKDMAYRNLGYDVLRICESDIKRFSRAELSSVIRDFMNRSTQ